MVRGVGGDSTDNAWGWLLAVPSLEWIGAVILLKVFISMPVSHLVGRYTLTHHLQSIDIEISHALYVMSHDHGGHTYLEYLSKEQ